MSPTDIDKEMNTSQVSADPGDIPTGNTFNKYGSHNRLVQKLINSFMETLDSLFAQANPKSLLDVGCGEGVLTHDWATRLGDGRVVGIDLNDPKLKAEWEKRQRSNLEFLTLRAENMPFDDNEFEVSTAIEVLEHVPDPEHTLSEMARCASSYLLVSVPREPLWRIVNVLRGAYITSLGNTPGHLNHWSKRGFVSLLSQYGKVIEVRSPFPWTMLLVELKSTDS